MKLNESIPGLPSWPDIRARSGIGTIEVSAAHVSIRRYVLARWLIRFALLTPWAFWFSAGILGAPSDVLKALAVLLGLVFVVVYIIVTVLPMPRYLARLLFPRHTSVVFTPETIAVSGKIFTREGVEIQFRAQRTPLSPRKWRKLANQQLTKNKEYMLRFLKVEMIYGMRIVPITSVADEDAAQQFAIALQAGLQMAHPNRSHVSSSPIERRPSRALETLPE